MKKVLILSCSTGQGHNSCATAVAEYFKEQEISCEVQDALAFISDRFSHFISWGHSWVYCHIPWLFSWGYHYSEKHPALFKEGSPICKLLNRGTEEMHTYISDGGYDTVICTHVFSAMMLTHMLKVHPMCLQTAFVATDYTCSPSMEESNLQFYFIPDKSLEDEYARHGIPRERMIPSGIPVRHDFWTHIDRSDAKRLLDIDPGHKHMLIMCGSMGCGPIPKMVRHIAEILPLDTEVTVICGSNAQLAEKLKRHCKRYKRIHIVGYTKQMSLYLDSANLYLTKPGGISVTEAAAKRCPMAFINAVSGCESYNMQFYMNKRAAITASTPNELADESIRVLHSYETLTNMEQALQIYSQPNGAACIYQQLNGGTPD